MVNFFGKPVEMLEMEDLDTLVRNEIPEGLYIEYKEDFPGILAPTLKIATSYNLY